MKKEKEKLEDVVELTRTIVRSYFSGNYEPYQERLIPNTVYVTGGITVYGDTAIIRHLSGLEGSADILNDDYRLVSLGNDAALVSAEVTTGSSDGTRRSSIQFTFVYKLVGGSTKLVYQHNSYNISYSYQGSEGLSPSVSGPYHALMRSLLLERSKEKRKKIIFHNSGEEILADPLTIIYMCGADKRVEVVCLGRIFTTDMTLKELNAALPSEFYQIHRSYIVNTNYISAVRRCEVELITGEKLPVPNASYTKIKRELIALMEK